MTSALKQRVIGAIFLLSLSVIFIPLFFDNDAPHWLNTYYSVIPQAPALPDLKKSIVAPGTSQKLTAAPQKHNNLAWLGFNPEKSKPTLEEINQECWSIRIGAFLKREDALALQDKLQDNGFPAYMREVPHTRLIGVFVGPELVRNNAETMLNTIKNQLGMEGTLEAFDPLA